MVENVPPTQAWEALKANPDTQLVDVRTDAEWTFVGVPDLSSLGKRLALIPWQVYPSMQQNAAFVDQLRKADLTPKHHIYFICRSGVRSLHAAEAAREAGFPYVYNVADGFEGQLDAEGHRGVDSGWKVENLPWRQR
jgi:rhodanese-related sulfurtransferase